MTLRVNRLLEELRDGKRGALARSITLLESRRQQDDDDRVALLQGCDDLLARRDQSTRRMAFTGPPGVGKSSLINLYGVDLVRKGHRVAVLAIDPSSESTGGSILGDKTRMPDLAREANAFIRPSPSSGHLGGIAEATREAVLVCEAAGFDRVIIETVGVGQSEYRVSGIVDAVVFLTMAGSGDGLQGIKRGILETVDVVAVNKSDGDGEQAALEHARVLKGALGLLRGTDAPECITTSAVTSDGLVNLSESIDALLLRREERGLLSQRRAHQRDQWFEDALMALLERRLRSQSEWTQHHDALQQAVRSGEMTPYAAAREFVARMGL